MIRHIALIAAPMLAITSPPHAQQDPARAHVVVSSAAGTQTFDLVAAAASGCLVRSDSSGTGSLSVELIGTSKSPGNIVISTDHAREAATGTTHAQVSFSAGRTSNESGLLMWNTDAEQPGGGKGKLTVGDSSKVMLLDFDGTTGNGTRTSGHVSCTAIRRR